MPGHDLWKRCHDEESYTKRYVKLAAFPYFFQRQFGAEELIKHTRDYLIGVGRHEEADSLNLPNARRVMRGCVGRFLQAQNQTLVPAFGHSVTCQEICLKILAESAIRKRTKGEGRRDSAAECARIRAFLTKILDQANRASLDIHGPLLNGQNMVALAIACDPNDSAGIAEMLITKYGGDISVASERGVSAFGIALSRPCTSGLSMLLRYASNAQLKCQINKIYDGYFATDEKHATRKVLVGTPIMIVSWLGLDNLLPMLLKRGADPNIQGIHGATAFDCALIPDSTQCMVTLCKSKYFVPGSDRILRTTLCAARTARYEHMNVLLFHGVSAKAVRLALEATGEWRELNSSAIRTILHYERTCERSSAVVFGYVAAGMTASFVKTLIDIVYIVFAMCFTAAILLFTFLYVGLKTVVPNLHDAKELEFNDPNISCTDLHSLKAEDDCLSLKKDVVEDVTDPLTNPVEGSGPGVMPQCIMTIRPRVPSNASDQSHCESSSAGVQH